MAQNYWVCPECETVSLTWPALRWHIKGKHTGVNIPEKGEVQVTEELPEGYRVIGQYKKGVAAPRAEGEEEEEKPRKEVTVPKELPEDFIERVKLSLGVHNFPDRLTTQVLNVLALHPETHDNPNNFANLLAHICSTYSGGVVHARKISLITSEVFGQPASEVPYAGTYGAQTQGYYGVGSQSVTGYYGPQPGAPGRSLDPITSWINYQIYKDSKEEERTKETKLPTSIEAELSAMRKDYEAAVKQFETVSAQLAEQKEMDKEAKHKAELAELRAEIKAATESKKGSGEGWLEAYLAERDRRDDDKDKRYQDTIKDIGDKLAEATREVTRTRQEADRKAADAVTTERTTRERVKKELEDAGYTTKTKTKEELDHEIQQTVLQVLPDKLDKGFDKLANTIGSLRGTSQSATTQQQTTTPRTPQEIAGQAELEESIIDEARKRGRA